MKDDISLTIYKLRYAQEMGLAPDWRKSGPKSNADIKTFDDLFPYIYKIMSKVDVKQYNEVLVNYAEQILKDPRPIPDHERRYIHGYKHSFLGRILRKVGKTTRTRPYSAALMELAGSIHVFDESGNDADPDEFACGVGFNTARLNKSGLFKYRQAHYTMYLVGTEKLKQEYGITVEIGNIGSYQWWPDIE
jgi:hypothetical protein